MKHIGSQPHTSFVAVFTINRQQLCSVRLVVRVLVFLCALTSASSWALAQNIQYSQGSVGSSLNNTLQIPLKSYPGRGGASLPITLYYSSEVWRIKYRSTICQPYDVSQSAPMADSKYAEYSRAGWTSSLGVPILEWPDSDELYHYDGKPGGSGCSGSSGSYRVPRLTVRMPDGSTHELRRDDQPYGGPENNTGVYYAVDGSRLRYDTATTTLFLLDGSRYILGATTVQFLDSNGNKLNYTRSTKQWTDTLGRVISSPPMGAAPGLYSYNLPGVDGTTTTYKLRWGYLSTALEPDAETGVVPELAYAGGHYISGTPSYTNPPRPLPSPQLFSSTESLEGFDGWDYVIASQNLFNPVVLKEIILPNGLMYKFGYNEYGEITRVTYPTGGFEQYKYGTIRTVKPLSAPYDQASRGVISRWVSPTGTGTDRVQWKYGVTYDSAAMKYTQWTINPNNTYAESDLFKAPSTSIYDNLNFTKFGFEDPRVGMAYEERFYQNKGGPLLRRTLKELTFSSREITVNFSGIIRTATAMRNPRPTREVTIVLDTGEENALAATTTFQYDTSHQFDTGVDLIATSQYDYTAVDQTTAQTGVINSIDPGLLLHKSETTYVDDPAYRDRNILGLPETMTIKNASGVVVAKAETFYDEPGYAVTIGGTATGWADPATTARGNATTTRRYTSLSPIAYLEDHTSYDQWGNGRSMWDARGNESEVDYSPTYKYAYATSTTTADPDGAGAALPLTTSTVYDFNTGLATTTTDANGQTTQMSYADDLNVVDPMNRLRKVIRPDGGWTTYDYNDVVGDLYVRTTTSFDATRSTESIQYVDALGRSSRSFASEGGSPATYLTIDTQYDSMGRVWRTSNPYRTTATTDPINPSNKWTANTYDALSRVKTVTLADATKVQTIYQGAYTTTTDQAGKQRRRLTNALGSIVRVDEPDDSGSIGTNDAPTQPTYYDYDALGNVVHVSQSAGTTVQHRYFKYDALSRLTYERQVEQVVAFTPIYDPVTGNSSWTRKLVYDEPIGTTTYKGLLTSHYDARNVRTRYTYDNLNRPRQVTYTDGTPTVTNSYDQAQAGYFNKGRLTTVQTAAVAASGSVPAIPATTQSYDYDLMGRVKAHIQTVGTQSYTFTYSYNLAGQLTGETYPSGRVVSYGYDDAARLDTVTSGATAYVSNFVYGSNGIVSSMSLGNGTSETFTYNTRFQLTSHKLLKGSTVLQRYDYKYGRMDVATGALDATKNNGQVASIDGYIGAAKQWQQRFGYDSLGRLTAAAEHRGDNAQRSYLINYDYDQFGNRYQHAASNPASSNPLGYIAVEDGDIDKGTNRFTSGITYDNAGNVKLDNKFTGRQYTYDANNRQKTVSVPGATGTTYTSVYDGAGQRVATINNGVTVYMVYDAMGKLVAEYGLSSKGSGGAQYVFSDRQGSVRVVTNQGGGVMSRQDYQPFGEELGAVEMRSNDPYYGGANSVRQGYAGMEEDEGSGMNHTLWRKYDSASGRWTSPDPYGGSMTVDDPQSFNRYTYVNNDPVNLTDPTGLMLSDIGVYQTTNPECARLVERAEDRGVQNWMAQQREQQRQQQEPQQPQQNGQSASMKVDVPFRGAFIYDMNNPSQSVAAPDYVNAPMNDAMDAIASTCENTLSVLQSIDDYPATAQTLGFGLSLTIGGGNPASGQFGLEYSRTVKSSDEALGELDHATRVTFRNLAGTLDPMTAWVPVDTGRSRRRFDQVSVVLGQARAASGESLSTNLAKEARRAGIEYCLRDYQARFGSLPRSFINRIAGIGIPIF